MSEMFVSTKNLRQYPWYLLPFFWLQRRRYGRILKPGLLWARSPKVFAAVAMLYGALDRRKSPLAPALRSLVTVRISQINWCAFCVDINSATLVKRGVDAAKIKALHDWQDSPLFSRMEKTALAYAEAVTRTDSQVTPEIIAELRACFAEDAIIELTALIAFQNMSSKFNAALRVPAEGFCSISRAGAGQDTGGQPPASQDVASVS